MYGNILSLSPPPIPDPDYSQSDEENEHKNAYKTCTLPLPGRKAIGKVTVRADGSMPRNFNVEEIRKARSLLKSSSSFQNYTNATEDGDNSSSGVSSDQEIQMAVSNGDDKSATNSTNKTVVQLPSMNCENEPKENELVVLPPPEYIGNVSPAAVEVLEPPPQFSDDRPVV